MSRYCLDVESFITEIKKRSVIWDLNNEDNRHKSKKQRAWDEIARLFVEDFDEMSDSEKNEVYRKLHGKWRNIRDSFVRNIKKPDGKKNYMYAKNLSFLNSIYNKTNSGSEAEENDSNSNQLWGESDDDRKIKNKRRRFQVLNDCNWSDDDPPSTIENLKKKRVINLKTEPAIEFVDTPSPLAAYPETSYPVNCVEDEDRSFFESLLPAVRVFDLDQKLDFRSQVITLVKNIRSAAQNKTSS